MANLVALALAASLHPSAYQAAAASAAAAARRWEAGSDVSSTSEYSDDGGVADMANAEADGPGACDDCQSCSGGDVGGGAAQPLPWAWDSWVGSEGRWPWLVPPAAPAAPLPLPQLAGCPACRPPIQAAAGAQPFVRHRQWQQMREGAAGKAAQVAAATVECSAQAAAQPGGSALYINAALFAELGSQPL